MLNNENWDLNEVGKTLNKAADLMDQLGHAKFLTQDANGSVCIQGAVYLALSGNTNGNANSAGKHLWLATQCFDALRKQLPTGDYVGQSALGDVCHWNNNSARTKDETVNFMREVARTCKVTA
jgi:hypothetical protein